MFYELDIYTLRKTRFMGTKFDGTDRQIAALNLFIKLMRASDSVAASINSFIAENGLSVSQFGVLESLYHLGPLNQTGIASKLLKTGGNITMVIDNLEKRGLVKRKRSKKDRRYIHVHITNEGSKLIKDIFPSHVDNIVARLSVLGVEEQLTMSDLLKRLGRGE